MHSVGFGFGLVGLVWLGSWFQGHWEIDHMDMGIEIDFFFFSSLFFILFFFL